MDTLSKRIMLIIFQNNIHKTHNNLVACLATLALKIVHKKEKSGLSKKQQYTNVQNNHNEKFN